MMRFMLKSKSTYLHGAAGAVGGVTTVLGGWPPAAVWPSPPTSPIGRKQRDNRNSKKKRAWRRRYMCSASARLVGHSGPVLTSYSSCAPTKTAAAALWLMCINIATPVTALALSCIFGKKCKPEKHEAHWRSWEWAYIRMHMCVCVCK